MEIRKKLLDTGIFAGLSAGLLLVFGLVSGFMAGPFGSKAFEEAFLLAAGAPVFFVAMIVLGGAVVSAPVWIVGGVLCLMDWLDRRITGGKTGPAVGLYTDFIETGLRLVAVLVIGLTGAGIIAWSVGLGPVALLLAATLLVPGIGWLAFLVLGLPGTVAFGHLVSEGAPFAWQPPVATLLVAFLPFGVGMLWEASWTGWTELPLAVTVPSALLALLAIWGASHRHILCERHRTAMELGGLTKMLMAVRPPSGGLPTARVAAV